MSAQTVDLANETERAALLKLWPIGKFPVLRDDTRNETVPESTVIIEYLDRHCPGRTQFIPGDDDRAWQTRLRDRFYDLYVHEAMQKIVGDRLRPEGKKDPHGVEEAKTRLRTSYRIIDQAMAMSGWAMPSVSPIAPPPRRCSMPTRSCRLAKATATSPHISIA